MNDIIVYPSKLKMFGLTIAAFVFLALNLFLLFLPGFYPHPVFFIILFLGVPLFGSVFVYLTYRLLVLKPSLVVNSTGIQDNASASGVGLLCWDEILEFVVYDYNFRGSKQRFLGINLVDANAVLIRLPWWKRLMIRANMRMGIAPINIPQNTLPMSADDLMVQIQAYREGLLAGNGHTHQQSPTTMTFKHAPSPKCDTSPDFLYQLKNSYPVARPLIFIVALAVGLLSAVNIWPLPEAYIPNDAYLGGSVGGTELLAVTILLLSALLVPLFPLCALRAILHRKPADIQRAKRCGGLYLFLIIFLSVLTTGWAHYYFYLDNQGIHLHPFVGLHEVHYRWDQVRGIHTFDRRNMGHGRPYYNLNFEIEMADGRSINILNRQYQFFATYPRIEKSLFSAQPNLPVNSECSNGALSEIAHTHEYWQTLQIINIMETGHSIPLNQPWPSDWHARKIRSH